jgi:hypothetical protein
MKNRVISISSVLILRDSPWFSMTLLIQFFTLLTENHLNSPTLSILYSPQFSILNSYLNSPWFYSLWIENWELRIVNCELWLRIVENQGESGRIMKSENRRNDITLFSILYSLFSILYSPQFSILNSPWFYSLFSMKLNSLWVSTLYSLWFSTLDSPLRIKNQGA